MNKWTPEPEFPYYYCIQEKKSAKKNPGSIAAAEPHQPNPFFFCVYRRATSKQNLRIIVWFAILTFLTCTVDDPHKISLHFPSQAKQPQHLPPSGTTNDYFVSKFCPTSPSLDKRSFTSLRVTTIVFTTMKILYTRHLENNQRKVGVLERSTVDKEPRYSMKHVRAAHHNRR
jgi:hypothetical protein